MTLSNYQQQVQRTLPDLGSLLLNSLHMTTGIATELFEEYVIALRKNDKVNISEELADAEWYVCNYATLYKIPLFPVPDMEKLDKGEQIENLMIMTGRLLDYDKKELAYGKPTDIHSRRTTLNKLLVAIEYVAHDLEIDMNEARQKVINKLRLRYPDKFDADKAINRDTEAERKVLES